MQFSRILISFCTLFILNNTGNASHMQSIIEDNMFNCPFLIESIQADMQSCKSYTNQKLCNKINQYTNDLDQYNFNVGKDQFNFGQDENDNQLDINKNKLTNEEVHNIPNNNIINKQNDTQNFKYPARTDDIPTNSQQIMNGLFFYMLTNNQHQVRDMIEKYNDNFQRIAAHIKL